MLSIPKGVLANNIGPDQTASNVACSICETEGGSLLFVFILFFFFVVGGENFGFLYHRTSFTCLFSFKKIVKRFTFHQNDRIFTSLHEVSYII